MVPKPNLQYALFCNSFDQQPGRPTKISVLDAVRVVAEVPDGQPPPRRAIPLQLVMGISGVPNGSHTLLLQGVRPCGQPMDTVCVQPVEWPADSRYIRRVIADFEIELAEDGVYTFKVLLDGEPLGSAMLNMSYRIERLEPEPSATV